MPHDPPRPGRSPRRLPDRRGPRRAESRAPRQPEAAADRPVRAGQHASALARSDRHLPRQPEPAGGELRGEPEAHRRHPDPGANDQQGHRAAEGQSERLLPHGRGRVHRQAGPCRESVRPDRRDRRPRTKPCRRPHGLRQGRWRDPGDRHRRPRPLQPDHPAGNRRAGADPTAHDQGRRAAGDQLRQLRRKAPRSTPAPSCAIAATARRPPMSPA